MKNSMTVQKILPSCKLSPLDAEILLSFVLKKPKEYFLAHPEKKLTASQERKFFSFCRRRSMGEPIAYIAGQKEFYGLGFFVDRNVLVPRPETEMLVEAALENIQAAAIIDVGTGSGNVIISVAKNIPSAARNKIDFYAADISKKALSVSRKNAKRHGVQESITFVHSDLLDFVLKRKMVLKKRTLIIANLPYVSPLFYKKYQKGLHYEPKTALLSRKNGLEHYIRLFKEIQKMVQSTVCRPPIEMILEISPEQKPILSKIIRSIFPKAKFDFKKDLAGKYRIANIKIV
jgi:release factor glutamine methyltransferase